MMTLAAMSAGKAIPARITQVLQQMQTIYGGNLVVTRLTDSEIDLTVRNMTSTQLIGNMMTRKADIFGADTGPATGTSCVLGPMDFEVLCQQEGPAGQGLFLRYLPNTPNRQDFYSGFWFY